LANINDIQARIAVNKMIQMDEDFASILVSNYPLVDANKLDEAKQNIKKIRLSELEKLRTRAIKILEN
jgi:methyl-accepting chemotaxis protein WspA